MIKTVENRFGFAGEMMDAVTGQYYLRARFYNPVIASFLSEDTYYGDGLNLYAYCHNNPVGYVDPSGHEGLICSKKYGELKKKETDGGTLSEKEKRQIYEYEQNQKKSNGAGSDSKSGSTTIIPDKAKDIAKQVKSNNGAPPKGYKGGRTYKNIPLEEGAQKLPEGVNYREYDINPYVKGQNRGAERIVIGDDNSVWYTNVHYYTFTQIE